MPLLGTYAGMSREEACELEQIDLELDAETPYVLVQANMTKTKDGETPAGLKRSSRRRALPLHPELLRLGFARYCDAVATEGRDMIFPELYGELDDLGDFVRWTKAGGPKFYSVAWRPIIDAAHAILPLPKTSGGKYADFHSQCTFHYSAMAAEGVSEALLARHAGHSQRTTGGRHYNRRALRSSRRFGTGPTSLRRHRHASIRTMPRSRALPIRQRRRRPMPGSRSRPKPRYKRTPARRASSGSWRTWRTRTARPSAPPDTLFREFLTSCRQQGVVSAHIDMVKFRRLFAFAVSGVGQLPAPARESIQGLAEGVDEDVLAPYLAIAVAAFRGRTKPDEDELARVYGSSSPGRIRRLLDRLERSNLIAVREDFAGERTISVLGLECMRAIEDASLPRGAKLCGSYSVCSRV